MKQDNNTIITRDKAIEWWASIHHNKAAELREKYFPGSMLISYADIQDVYISEHPEQSLPSKEALNNK